MRDCDKVIYTYGNGLSVKFTTSRMGLVDAKHGCVMMVDCNGWRPEAYPPLSGLPLPSPPRTIDEAFNLALGGDP